MSSDSRYRTQDDAEVFFARRLGIRDINRGMTSRESRMDRIWLAMSELDLIDKKLGINKAGVEETYGQAFSRIYGQHIVATEVNQNRFGSAETDELSFGLQESQR